MNLAEGKEEKGRNKKEKKKRIARANREREGEGGSRTHRERWQFIRVPRIVDTYYHAKYNMLTTSHNVGPRSSRFSFPALRTYDRSTNRVSAPRKFYCRCGSADAARFRAVKGSKGARFSRPFPEPPGFWKREPPSVCYNQEATPYDSLFMNSSFLMQNSRVVRIYGN